MNNLNDWEFVNLAYQLILQRDPDREAVQWLDKLRQGVTRFQVVEMLSVSDEFRFRLLRTAGPLAGQHRARMLMIQNALPAGEVVVDLGGGCEDDPRGALLTCGYPYRPRELHIIDLPPEARLVHAGETAPTVKDGACTIQYHYRSMADLSCFADNSVDFVWSGQSIEHVSVEDGRKTMREVRRILKPGGKFCLDTPNRKVTKLTNPRDYIHPEHKIEYLYDQLKGILLEEKFRIDEARGVILMKDSIQKGQWLEDEFYANLKLNDDPDNSNFLFFVCSKPA